MLVWQNRIASSAESIIIPLHNSLNQLIPGREREERGRGKGEGERDEGSRGNGEVEGSRGTREVEENL